MVVQIVRLFLGERDDQITALGGDSGWIVPFEIVRFPVVQVDSFPVRVVSRVERPALDVELVGENELELFARTP